MILSILCDKTAWDEFIAYIKDEYGQKDNDWWSYFGSPDILILTQTTLTLKSNIKKDSHLLIKNIKKNEDGYIITVKEGTAFQKYNKWWNWPNPEEYELFNILLIPDGDYIDLYLENKNNLIDTFVFVNKEFMAQLNNLKFNRPVDLTKITFPRRSDGSTDYPLPELSADTNITEETKNNDNTAIAESAIEKNARKGMVFRVIMIASIAVLLGGGVAVVVVKRRK